MAIFNKSKNYSSMKFSVSAEEKQLIANLSKGNSKFAFEIYRDLSLNDENVLISPFSVSALLIYILKICKDNFVSQLKKNLYLKHFSSIDEINDAFACVFKSLISSRDYSLFVANAMYIDKRNTMLQKLLDSADYDFKIKVVTMDKELENEVKEWVEQQTNHNVNAFQIQRNIAALKLQIIYFNGNWEKEFNERYSLMTEFHLLSGVKEPVKMMSKRDYFYFDENPQFKCKILQLNVIGNRFVVFIILPNQFNGIYQLQEHLTLNMFKSLRYQMSYRKVTVNLPKFTIKYKKDLKNVLRNVLVNNMFDTELIEHNDFGNQLFISSFYQESFLCVNEKGIEVGSVSGLETSEAITIAPRCAKLESKFTADHPFIFIVYDNLTESILFVGNLDNPLN